MSAPSHSGAIHRHVLRWLPAFAGLWLVGCADLSIMEWKYGWMDGLDLDRFLDVLRTCGEPWTLAGVVILVAIVDSQRRIRCLQLGLTALLAEASVCLGKFFIFRTRPPSDNNWSLLTFAWPRFAPDVHRAIYDARHSSFPSGHSTAAFAFAVSLACFYPRLRWTLWMTAAGCAIARFLQNAHWPSDCWAGAMVGTASAILARCIIQRRGPRFGSCGALFASSS